MDETGSAGFGFRGPSQGILGCENTPGTGGTALITMVTGGLNRGKRKKKESKKRKAKIKKR